MNSRARNKSLFAASRRLGFSLTTLCWCAALVVVAVAASFADLDAVLRYFKVIHGAAPMTLETAAALSLAVAIPFLGMGMSISADSHRAQRERKSRHG